MVVAEAGPTSLSPSEAGSISHQGEAASPSEAVWNEELRDRGVEVRSGDTRKSSGLEKAGGVGKGGVV